MKLFDKKIEKNFIYNVLKYISSDGDLSNIKINDLLLTNHNKNKISSFIENKEIYNKYNNNNIPNDFIKGILYNKNNTKNKIEYKYIKTNENLQNLIKIENKNEFKNYSQENIDKYNKLINGFINIGIYENIYDFFFSHFVVSKITIESFLGNYINYNVNSNINIPETNTLKFDFSINIDNNSKKEMVKEFIKFFKSFSDDDLYLFNKTISGNTHKLSKKYIIDIKSNDSTEERLPIFHTCYNTMDVSYYKFRNDYFKNKNNFIELLKMISGNFTIA